MNKQVQIKRRTRRKRPCPFCVDKINMLDYKNIGSFKRFITERGKISPKRNTGVCAKHQRMLAQAIKRARFMGLVPFCVD